MAKKKYTAKKLKRLAVYIETNVSRQFILNRFGISEASFRSWRKKAISAGYLTEELYESWLKIRSKIRKKKVEKTFQKRYGKSFGSVGWESGMGSNRAVLKSAARAGGLRTQELHPHVLENLENGIPYGGGKKYYDLGGETYVFGSSGERYIALILLELGWFTSLKRGDNFQRKCGSCWIDFYNNGVGVEFHPLPKEETKRTHDTIELWKESREKQLKEYGFDEKLVVIENQGELYDRLPEIGLEVLASTYYSISRKVTSKIKEYDDKLREESENWKDCPF